MTLLVKENREEIYNWVLENLPRSIVDALLEKERQNNSYSTKLSYVASGSSLETKINFFIDRADSLYQKLSSDEQIVIDKLTNPESTYVCDWIKLWAYYEAQKDILQMFCVLRNIKFDYDLYRSYCLNQDKLVEELKGVTK